MPYPAALASSVFSGESVKYFLTGLAAPSLFRDPEVRMTTDSPVPSWIQQFTQFRCPDCGGNSGFRSRRRTFAERCILPFFLLQPVRCGECFHRDYRLIFTPVRKRLSEASGMLPASHAAPPSHRNVA
jgi:hypothetical protein